MASRLVHYLACLLLCVQLCNCLLLATFNIQIFGQKKMKDQAVRDTLVKILKRYHLVFIQEIRDSKGTAFPQLVEELNKISEKHYLYTLSARLGRSSSKEQYGVIYDPKEIKILETYQDPDPANRFERPPFVVSLKFLKPRVKKATFVIIHIDPDKVVREMDALFQVTNNLDKRFKQPMLILGDMNADCGYLSRRQFKILNNKMKDHYNWLIPSGVDTTVGPTNCTYDRMITRKSDKKWIQESSAGVFRFDKAFGLAPDQAKKVSDHYPVEIKLL